MINYTNLPQSEKEKLRALIKKNLNEYYQSDQRKNNRSHEDSILEEVTTTILQIAVSYKIIEEACVYNSCYINRVKSHIYDLGSADDITNKILMTFQSCPTVMEAAIDEALENAAFIDQEPYEYDDWDLER